MATSQNGYTANDVNLTESALIPGTSIKVRLRKGAAGQLLRWVASQFDKRVEDIDPGVLDDWGYAERTIRGSSTDLSNHASGTAIDLNATRHPLGTNPSANFSQAQLNTIHAVLAQAQGCVRWGGDYTGRKDPMHFEIVASEAKCASVLAAINSGAAAQTQEDDLTPDQANRLIWCETALRTLINQATGDPQGDPSFGPDMKWHDGNFPGFVSRVDGKTSLSPVDFIRYIDAASNATRKNVDTVNSKVDALSIKLDAIAAALATTPEEKA
jgi:hypothetical protein